MYRDARPNQDLTGYVGHIVESLLRDLAFGVQRTLEQPAAESIHDLRRVCLRLRHVVRLFEGTLPSQASRRIRRRLGVLHDLLGAVRSVDVALATLGHHGVAAALTDRERKAVAAALAATRRQELRPLRTRLRRLQRADAPRRWRVKLLGSP